MGIAHPEHNLYTLCQESLNSIANTPNNQQALSGRLCLYIFQLSGTSCQGEADKDALQLAYVEF